MVQRLRRTCSVVLAAALAATVVATVAPAAQAAGSASLATIRSPEVQVTFKAKVGQWDGVLVTVASQCFGGAIVQELVLDVVTDEATANRSTTDGIVCDGVRRVVEYGLSSGGPEFESGPADVSARLTVLDPDTHDPLPQAFDLRTVKLLAPIEFRVLQPVKLNPDNSVSVPVGYRCQEPWIGNGDGFGVSVSQNRGRTFASVFWPGLVCDGVWHNQRVRVPSGEKPFHEGGSRVDAYGDVLDPVHFDPVAGGTDTKFRPITRW